MAKDLPRVEEILHSGEWAEEPVDRVVLDYDDRFRRRIVLCGQHGTRLLLDLPEPQLLMDGDGLRLDTGEIVAVEDAGPIQTLSSASNTLGSARTMLFSRRRVSPRVRAIPPVCTKTPMISTTRSSRSASAIGCD